VTGLLLKERDEGAADIGGIAGGRMHGRRSVGTGLAVLGARGTGWRRTGDARGVLRCRLILGVD
jgi:hypothetical protein